MIAQVVPVLTVGSLQGVESITMIVHKGPPIFTSSKWEVDLDD